MRFSINGREMNLESTLASLDTYFALRATAEEKAMYRFFLDQVEPESACMDGNHYGDRPVTDFVEGRWNGHDPEKVMVRLGIGNNQTFLQLMCIDKADVELFHYREGAEIVEPLAKVKAEFLAKVHRYEG